MDKSLLNVSGILSIVFGIICCLTIVLVFIGIPMIIGGCKLRGYSQLSDKDILEKKDSILIWSIVFIFINTICGILSLIFYINLENSEKKSSSSSSKKEETRYDDLERIKKLYDDKALTKAEYEAEKEKILGKK